MNQHKNNARAFLIPFLILAFIPVCISAQPSSSDKSIWVYPATNGKLQYKTTERGDRIMDFSYAGYMGGGVAFPDPPIVISLEPVAGDNTAAIQQAINTVSKMNPVNGFRGTVLL